MNFDKDILLKEISEYLEVDEDDLKDIIDMIEGVE